MFLQWEDEGLHQLSVRALLETGCTTLLLGQACADRFRIPRNTRKEKIELRNFTGELVTGAGEAYSIPLLL